MKGLPVSLVKGGQEAPQDGAVKGCWLNGLSVARAVTPGCSSLCDFHIMAWVGGDLNDHLVPIKV